MSMAEKMYNQNGKGKGKTPSYDQAGTGVGKAPSYTMNGNGLGKDVVKKQPMGSFKMGYGQSKPRRMINGSTKPNQKGQASLKSTGNNEGEKMMLGKDGSNRS